MSGLELELELETERDSIKFEESEDESLEKVILDPIDGSTEDETVVNENNIKMRHYL